MEIRWSPEAAEELERIVGYLQRDSPPAAAEIGRTIFDGVDDLRAFPHRGREGRIENTRELVFNLLPYIVVYRVKNEVIQIVRVYHAAQDWP
jgi:toxin ParE1/3/4